MPTSDEEDTELPLNLQLGNGRPLGSRQGSNTGTTAIITTNAPPLASVATNPSSETASISNSVEAQLDRENRAFDDAWADSSSGDPASSQIRTHLIPDHILVKQPYTIGLLTLIASNGRRMHTMELKIEELTADLLATQKALAELSPPAKEAAPQSEQSANAHTGDFYSKVQKKWIIATPEFRTAVLWNETDAQIRFDKQETLNLPLADCLFDEDGECIKSTPIYRAIRDDCKSLIVLQLATLADKAHQSKYRMWAFYKEHYRPHLMKVCQALANKWPEIAMCSGLWKARALVARELRNLRQTTVKQYKPTDPDASTGSTSQTPTTPTTPASSSRLPTIATMFYGHCTVHAHSSIHQQIGHNTFFHINVFNPGEDVCSGYGHFSSRTPDSDSDHGIQQKRKPNWSGRHRKFSTNSSSRAASTNVGAASSALETSTGAEPSNGTTSATPSFASAARSSDGSTGAEPSQPPLGDRVVVTPKASP
ncbi:hypothetical protein A4X13_0g7302 [Tilletia indica]|uniref:Uncharacterized protein n=1 Tax=Tilletia indica TaxID=43049 RepID=A0A8T8SK61_9BASI|nr:hypothetical protein A4X13_0g7302 [Tilletia indica]